MPGSGRSGERGSRGVGRPEGPGREHVRWPAEHVRGPPVGTVKNALQELPAGRGAVRVPAGQMAAPRG